MDLQGIDLRVLDRLRSNFLDGAAGAGDYWRKESDLDAYDRTFARRIGWKCDYVLAELARRGWSPPAGAVMDWGCGSGAAGRCFLRRFAPTAGGVDELILHDRSSIAVRFAAGKARAEFPTLKVSTGGNRPFATILISHVIGELSPAQTDELVALAGRAQAIIWAEPGAFEASRSLIAIRERLMGEFRVVAPCTHQAACGMLAETNSRHWCHHFVTPPQEVSTDGDWVRFGRQMGIDLRSLPVSFIVMDRRPATAAPRNVTVSAGEVAVRVIGRPRVHNAYAYLFGCDESGVRDRRLMKRHLPEQFRLLKKDQCDPLQVWRCEGDEILAARPL